MEIVSRYPDTVNMVVDIMADVSRGENERREGVGVLAQLTSSNNHQDMLPIITSHISKIYNAIQNLLETSSSEETFLLCAATTANLSSISSSSCSANISHQLLSSLLSHPACSSSVYIQEQMVTVINNMTRSNTNIISTGALEYLLESLNLSSTSRQKTNDDQYGAAHRTVSKAVIGLARLCLHESTSIHLIRLGGLARLTRVVEEDMFMDDETVKLAVVAALRSVCTDYSTESFV